MTEQPSITCPQCGMTSYNPHDIRWGYCGMCHDFTGEKLAGTPNPNWKANQVVTDRPVVRHGPTPPSADYPTWMKVLAALAGAVAIGFVVLIILLTAFH